MITRLTPEQGEKIKGIINNDANLIEAYLKIKDLDYEDWSMVYEMKHPSPKHWDRMYSVRRDVAWQEEVNKKLLPENVVGACVVGGFFLALLAEQPEKKAFLPSIWQNNESRVEDLPSELVVLLIDEYGLNLGMLETLQSINDVNREIETRRTTLKACVDIFVEEGFNDEIENASDHYFDLVTTMRS